MTGNAYIADPSQPGKLGVSFSSIFNTGSVSGNSSNYIVVDTDYTNYSLVYSCSVTFYGLIKNEQAWILSRARTLNQTIVDNLFVKIKAISPGIINSVKKTDQTKCPA
jgi:lipocalin